jgi:DNA-binding transcriptional LysR family regulator
VGAVARDKRVVCTPVGHDEVVLVGPRPNPFAPSLRLARAELGRVPLIVRERGSGTAEATAALVPDDATVPPIQVGSSEAARRCVLQGLGLSFLSRRSVAEDVAAGRLAVVALPGTPVRRRFYAARLRTHTLSGVARAFLRAIEKLDRA